MQLIPNRRLGYIWHSSFVSLSEATLKPIVLLPQELSRFSIGQVGRIEEALQIKADLPRKALSDGGPKGW
jgi:hypothetical protein